MTDAARVSTANKIAKGVAGLSLASFIRLCRYGPADAVQRSRESYRAIDPFGRFEAVNGIPAIRLDTLISRKGQIFLDDTLLGTDGALTAYEALTVVMLAREANPAGVLEIGTYNGSTTFNLARNLPQAMIHTLDLPLDFSPQTSAASLPMDDAHLIAGRKLGAAFTGTPEQARIRQHLGDSATYDLSKISEPLTVFFIDGSHTYEYAKSDTLRCLAAATGPLTFLWHDCDEIHPGVTRWLHEMMAAGFPVSRIANTLLAYARIDASSDDVKRRAAALGA